MSIRFEKEKWDIFKYPQNAPEKHPNTTDLPPPNWETEKYQFFPQIYAQENNPRRTSAPVASRPLAQENLKQEEG